MKMANANWKTVGLPKCKPHDFSEEVLVTWIPSWNKSMRLVSTAVYVPHHWCTTDDLGWNTDDFAELEYCEEKDEWWVPCGWYETTTNCIDGIGYVDIEGEVIAWDRMPKPYKEKLTNMQDIDTWKQQTMSRFERVE